MNDVVSGAEPEIRPKAKISKIWILPIVAVIIGIGMVYNSWQNRGVEIAVTFETAEGLLTDKTVVKYRNVDIGLVKNIGFSEDHDSIVVDIEIDKGMRELLLSDSQFWVVKPRVGADGISGIGTILSGSYIELSPGEAGIPSRQFVGLEAPPVTTSDDDGLHLTLTSKGGQTISVGDPVVYRGFKVGQIVSFEFNPAARQASYGIFVRAPYDALVTSNTFFWNAGGLSVNATAQGMKVNIASLETLISGGVQFDVPGDLDVGIPINNNRSFALYDSLDSVENRREYRYFTYAMLVEDSVGGLYEGAPVEYRGIRIGTVESPHLNFEESIDDRIPIIIRIEPGRVYKDKNTDLDEFKEVIESGIKDGMAASIESANLLTGTLKITIDYHGEPVEKIEMFGKYPVIPTKRGGIAGIAEKFDQLLSKLEDLPLQDTVGNANRMLNNTDNAIVALEQSLQELQTTLQGYQAGTEFYQNMTKTMVDLQVSLRNLQPLLKQLNNKPNSLIFGGAQQADAEPTINTGEQP